MRRIVTVFATLTVVGGTAGCSSSPADMIPASERAMATVEEQPAGYFNGGNEVGTAGGVLGTDTALITSIGA